MSDPTDSRDSDELEGEIWSKSLKYLDFVAHYKPETSEHYYIYRDDKARELAEDVIELVEAYADRLATKRAIEELNHVYIVNGSREQLFYMPDKKSKDMPIPLTQRLAALKATLKGDTHAPQG